MPPTRHCNTATAHPSFQTRFLLQSQTHRGADSLHIGNADMFATVEVLIESESIKTTVKLKLPVVVSLITTFGSGHFHHYFRSAAISDGQIKLAISSYHGLAAEEKPQIR